MTTRSLMASCPSGVGPVSPGPNSTTLSVGNSEDGAAVRGAGGAAVGGATGPMNTREPDSPRTDVD
ncbi:hypothetical protein AB4212_37935, partial [Streptomyces sp. 2MCAF27]